MKKNAVGTSNNDIAELLRAVAAVYLIKKENKFKVIAYENAAGAIEHLDREVKDVWQEGKLDKIPGLGPSIREHLDEVFRKGHSSHFDALFKKVPEAVFELMKIPSIGPLTAYKLATSLGLRSAETVFDDLKKAAQEKKIASLPGFGHKSQEEILSALSLYGETAKSSTRGRMPLPYAYSLARQVIKYLKRNKHVKRVDALGSLRRFVTTIGDIDIAIEADLQHGAEIIDHFVNYPKKLSVDNKGPAKASIIIFPGIRVDLRIQEPATYGSMLQYFTGGKAHNIKLREYAQKKGLSLSEYGIKSVKTGKIQKFETEEEFYKELNLPYIPPEIREGTNEIGLAEAGKIPDLVDLKDIKGDFHIHSSYDLKPSHDFGNHSYQELAQKAHTMRYSYIGFSDHNPKLANHSEADITTILKRRKEFMKRTLGSLPLPYFIGLEVDILPNGRLAVPREAVQYLDYMIVSVHSVFRMEREKMTRRVLEALKADKVKILGHPTGRLLQKREGYELEWEKIFEVCKKNGIAMEINAWPQRLDLSDTLVRLGLGAGVNYMINTDSHDTAHMDNMLYGVSVARRGWCTKYDIINTKDLKSVKEWLLR